MAAARARADLAESADTPAAEPPITRAAEPPFPQVTEPHAEHEPAPTATTRGAANHSPRPTATKPTDPAVLFARLAAVVRDSIALEVHLAAAPTAAHTARAQVLHADPRRASLRELVRRTTQNHPDRAALNRDITARLDEALAADPDRTIDPMVIIDAICAEFGVDIDLATLPDEYLFDPCETTDQAEDDLDPCATSPP
jgi:hypothetical protein